MEARRLLALVKYAPGRGNVELREVPEPELGPGQVMVRVAAVGVCGTDRAAIEGAHDYFPTPRIVGHEVAGVVTEVGPDVTEPIHPGDHVTLETDAYICGVCAYCRREENNRCPYRRGIGTTTDGGLAEWIAIRAPAVHRLPPGLPLTVGALVEPLAISVHAVIERSADTPITGEVVVVTGPGAIGLLSAQVARAAGATVVLVGRARHAERLELARELGIDHAVDGDAVDVPKLVGELTDGLGAAALYESSGGAGVLETAPPLLRKGGRIVLAGFFRNPPELDIDRLVNDELEIAGSRGKRPSSYRRAIHLLVEGQVQLEPLIDHRLPLDEWRHGLERMAAGAKVVFEPDR
jgi:L-iditol 2-dehydrogenase